MSKEIKLTTVYKPNGKPIKVNDNSLSRIGIGELSGWTRKKPSEKTEK